jgi:archaellum component FlaF (FlaF/FlaG flagellin family)
LKRSVTILIIFILFFAQFGYRYIYLIKQYQLKEEAEEKLITLISDDQFEQINFEDNRKNINWEEEGKEFTLNGQMYDVAKTKIVEGKTILFCLNDEKEEQLVEDMLKKIQSNNDSSPAGKHGKHIIKFQLSDFTLVSIKPLSHNVFLNHGYRYYTAAIHAAIKEVNTPPPNNQLSLKLTL